ncbi:MAG TPA: hypothetical protein VF735_20435 [Pyrinomonadaceae bacterium]|jgi:hypothetical protein
MGDDEKQAAAHVPFLTAVVLPINISGLKLRPFCAGQLDESFLTLNGLLARRGSLP